MKTNAITTEQNVLKTIRSIGLIMILLLCTNTLFAQNTDRTVTGVVTCIDGPLLGATVVLKGTTIAITSNENGGFTFPQQLKENDVLLVSYLGYKNQEIKIKEDTTFVEPFLDDIPIIIVASLRMEDGANSQKLTSN